MSDIIDFTKTYDKPDVEQGAIDAFTEIVHYLEENFEMDFDNVSDLSIDDDGLYYIVGSYKKDTLDRIVDDHVTITWKLRSQTPLKFYPVIKIGTSDGIVFANNIQLFGIARFYQILQKV